MISNEARVLRQMRLAKGLSMRAAGALIGKSDSYISQIENGRMDVPKEATLELLLNAYGGGIKPRSFYERARLLRSQITPRMELLELVERLDPQKVSTALAVVRSLLS